MGAITDFRHLICEVAAAIDVLEEALETGEEDEIQELAERLKAAFVALAKSERMRDTKSDEVRDAKRLIAEAKQLLMIVKAMPRPDGT
jgi:hypothetical protein